MKKLLLIVLVWLTHYSAYTQANIEVQLVDVVVPQAYTHVHVVMDYLNISNSGGPTIDRVILKSELPTTLFSNYFASTPSPLVMMDFNYVSVYHTGTGYYLSANIPFTYYTFNRDSQSCNWQTYEINFGGMKLIFQVRITPSLFVTSLTQTQYCENEKVALSAYRDLTLSNYTWEFQDSPGGPWKPFAIPPANATSSNIQVGLNNLYGSGDNSSNFNRAILFSVRVGSCSRVPITQSVRFFPISPQVIDDDPVDPACHEGRGSYTIQGFNRPTGVGETFKVSVIDISDPQNEGATPFITSSALPVTITGLSPGTFSVTVESSLGGQFSGSCGAAPVPYEFTINNPDPVEFSVTSTQSPSCHVNTVGIKNNGEIRISATGGTGNDFEYALGSGSFQPMGSNTFAIAGLTAGNYAVKVKDGNDCESPVENNIPVQPAVDILLSADVTSNYNNSDIKCAGSTDGIITAAASGGTTPLDYSLNGTDFSTSPVFTGLGAGSYTITVKDGNNCTKATTPIPIATPPAITASLTAKSATCFGRNDGEITVVNPSGGTGALSFSVNNGTNYQTNQLFIDVPPGARNVIIRDENLCTSTFNTTVDAPSQISITPTSTIVTCSGGSDGEISVTASNIQSTAQYSLNGTAFQSTNVFTGLASNSYTVTVRESSDPTCLNTASVTLNANPVITGAITVPTVISCNTSSDGSLNLTPGGGVGPYSYTWNTGATTEDLSNLAAGTYTVTITDSKNCTKDFNRVLTAPAPIGITYGLSDYTDFNIRCTGESNGSINLIASGGNGGYGYTWNTGATSQNLSSLPAGTYTVTVRDSKNCTGTQAITLTQPPPLANTLTTQNVLCFGDNSGIITFATTGGTGADTYQYSINNGSNWSPTPTFNNLITGTYAIQVRDENGCTLTDNRTLTSPPEIQLTLSNITNTTCNQNNGSAQAISTGGAGTHSYTWLNSGNQTIATASSATNLQAGVYSIRVTDQNACTKQQTVTISSSNGPQITTGTITPTTCHDTADGTATINITQGQAPYTIKWPNNHNTETAANLTGGEYIVEVRDQTNCLALHTITIPSPAPITITTTEKTDPNCADNADGKITTLATGGNGTYTYTWNTGATTNNLTNITAGTYTLQVKDIKNCTRQEQIILIDPPVFTVDLGPDQKICEGMLITQSSTEDNAAYQWTSTNGYTSDQQQVNLTEPGTYTLTVTTIKGCTATDSFELTIDPDLLKADFLMVNEAHVGDTVVMIDISWPMPQSISWTLDAQATIIDQTPDYSMVRYEESGSYATQLTATLAQCISTYEQWITILEAEDTEDEQAKTGKDFIKTFIVYPNPTPGVLSVKVELAEQEPLTLEVYQAQSNQKVYGKMIEATTEHIQTVDLSKMAGGVYIVRIKAGNETKSVKLIKVY